MCEGEKRQIETINLQAAWLYNCCPKVKYKGIIYYFSEGIYAELQFVYYSELHTFNCKLPFNSEKLNGEKGLNIVTCGI